MNLSDSKKKLALAGVVCGIVAAGLAALEIRQTWHSVLLLYPRYGRSNGTASGGSGTVCKT